MKSGCTLIVAESKTHKEEVKDLTKVLEILNHMTLQDKKEIITYLSSYHKYIAYN